MSAPTAPRPLSTDSDDIDPATTVTVYNCSRLGLRANPPRRGLMDLLFPTRRR